LRRDQDKREGGWEGTNRGAMGTFITVKRRNTCFSRSKKHEELKNDTGKG